VPRRGLRPRRHPPSAVPVPRVLLVD
jgi:hypothetical protein